MVSATWRNYIEGDAETRIVLMVFVGVGVGIFLVGVTLALNTIWRLATLPRNWRASPARVARTAAAKVGLLEDLKIAEIFIGVVGFGFCFVITVLLLLQAEGFVTRKGSFGGGGVSIVLPS